ncbi:hypothetical protein ACLB1T_07540 [Escherichia coli]
MQCSGSDALSGVTANPAVGYASDLLVRCGATVRVCLSREVTEVRDAIHLLTPRAVNEEVGKQLLEEMKSSITISISEEPTAAPDPRRQQKASGKRGERALGSIAESGKSAIVEVLSPRSTPTKRGLIYATTPASDFAVARNEWLHGYHRASVSTSTWYAVRPDGGTRS